ncbi:MAG: ABC transporter substrate-binding protein, partial [Alphaproteobacteria bacterium]|nr:ABC transporter substrate-binding protein [Alphaproteobacteria bacterium]
KRWMTIGPDYAYGHESWTSFSSKLKELQPDADLVGEIWPKLMEKDYAPFIQKLLDEKPDAVWSSLWGNDAVNFIRQALPTGLVDKIKFAFADGAALETLSPLGKDMPNGIFASTRYFFLTPDSSLNRSFVQAYHDRYQEFPDYMAEETYAGVYFLKAALERAGTTDSSEVIKAIEREPLAWETPEGWKVMRREDHSVVEDVVWGETSFSDKYGFAVLRNIQSIQAEEICRTPEELLAVRSNYDKRLSEVRK